MRMTDPLTAFIESEIDTTNIVSSLFPEWMSDFTLVPCPWHEDTKSSLNIDPTGKAYCHGCGMKIRDIVDLVAKVNGWSYVRAQKELYAEVVEAIPDSKIDVYVRALNHKSKPRKWLEIERNISPSIIEKYKLGYDKKTKRITVPVYDQFGACVNIRKIAWLEDSKYKVINVRGKGENRIYPEKDLVLNRRILLCAGELDCLCAKGYGLPAVTWTGGENSWNDSYTEMFRGKAVWIWYDNDKAGRKGADAAYEKLKPVVQFVDDVPMPFETHEAKDLTDMSFVCPSFIHQVKIDMDDYVFPSTKTKKKRICPTCGQEIP